VNPFGTSKTTKAAAGTLAGLLLACAGSAFVQANDTEPSSVPATSQSSSLSNLLRSSSSSTPSEPSAPPEEVLDCVSPFGRAHFQLDLNGPVGPNQQASTHRLTGNILPLPDGDLAVCMLQGAFLSVIKLHWPTHRPSSFLAFPGDPSSENSMRSGNDRPHPRVRHQPVHPSGRDQSRPHAEDRP